MFITNYYAEFVVALLLSSLRLNVRPIQS